MVTAESEKNGISQALYDACTEKFLTPVDVKKIDIGGGLIHGKAEDFAGDPSGTILPEPHLGAAHRRTEGDRLVRRVRSAGHPGEDRTWITSSTTGCAPSRPISPDAARHDIEMLGNSPLHEYTPDTIIQRADLPAADVYLLLSGEVELIDSKTGLHNRESAGALINDLECFSRSTARRTCRALSNVMALRIPCEIYRSS